jgi:hypothetical protein
MGDTKKTSITVTESRYPWERDALDFVRERWPDHDPYRAWANFEFIALDGSINEVDLLLLTPMGLFLVEVKSRPGRVFGDPGTWTWETDGRLITAANPLLSANLKAKKLKPLLLRQKAVRTKDAFPFIEPLVFLSAPNLVLELRDTAAYGVCLRDLEAGPGRPERPGILAAVRSRNCPGLRPLPGPIVARPLARVVGQAIEQAGIPSGVRKRRVSDYLLEQLLEEGPGYQDWEAGHVQGIGGKRRIRLYLVENEATADDREMIRRAARRDFQLTEALQHPGVLRALGYTEHEVGPAVVFEHDPNGLRLDHFLAQRGVPAARPPPRGVPGRARPASRRGAAGPSGHYRPAAGAATAHAVPRTGPHGGRAVPPAAGAAVRASTRRTAVPARPAASGQRPGMPRLRPGVRERGPQPAPAPSRAGPGR